ncbi:MAG TPA: DoxX family protein, partial [Terriglobia bacterium]|nr:DoxX family protein [Terriglobia bacterium]
AFDALRNKETVLERWLARLSSITLPLARIGAAALFFQYGARKIFGWFGGRVAEFGSQLWVAGMMEVLGAPLLALGLLTRPVAFLLSGEMAVAFWGSHVPRGPTVWPIQNGGEPAVLFCFLYLYLTAAGPGWFSLDRLCLKKLS